MAGLQRPVSALSSRKNSMRPPITRPTTVRTQSSAPALHARSGAASPADSLLSVSTCTSSPKKNGGIKRKAQEFDADAGQETNINVVVRCRGRNDRELRENSGVVVSTDGVRGKNVELSMGPSALSNKTYHFDKVFSPAADQSMIYDDVVTPILDEMLQGYNCTIFAYGQTGTGKTYTMSGDMSDTLGLISDCAGIIPRALHSLFSKLEADDGETSVKCSFIELYNEELRDLLSLDDTIKLKIFEDGQKKGHAATMVQGMEEAYIKSAGAGIKLLQDGSHKRQVAATKCNDLSSRSHTVFTVTAYVKRTTETGEDFVSAGKLNLVDLAGSENIQRSGAENKRAAEAGLINKSLLTLGRVINALVERAKNIRNKPQINQTISKKTLLREFTAEIEKLKAELIATRQRNGVYLTTEGYDEIIGESESRRILSEEQAQRIETMEVSLRNKVQELFNLTNNFTSLKKDNESTKQTLDETKGVLEKTEFVLANTRQTLAEETALRKAHQSTEEQLTNVGRELLSTLKHTTSDIDSLHSKDKRRSDLQALNRQSTQQSQSQVTDVTQMVESHLENFQKQQDELVANLSDRMHSFVQEELQKLGTSQSLLQEKVASFASSEKEVIRQTSGAKEDMDCVLEEIKVLREDVKRKVGEGLNGLSVAAGRISADVINELGIFHTQLHTSYSSLGKDFKNVFEELVKHVNAQKAEAEDLRRQVSEAASAAIQADAEVSARLEICQKEERAQASEDRQQLLAQITNLVMRSGESQDARWNSKIAAVREDIASLKSTLQSAETSYGQGMDVWSEKEALLVQEVLKSRESLKAKMKEDWKAINDHNTSIQTTTKSVHEETIRIVDAQMKDMANQMQALDEFVRRARSQNERHHSTHVESLQSLASNVRQSYSSIGNHFGSTYDRVREIGVDISTQSTTIQASLQPLDSTIKQPLVDLRTHILEAPLKEYTPTGETPRKVQYQYPTILPQSEPHKTLLGRPNPASHSHPVQTPNKSPNKAMVYTDGPEIEHGARPHSSTPSKNSETASLREISLNVNGALNRNNSDSAAPTLTTSKADVGVIGMGPPPLKRQATESKLPTKLAGGRGGFVRLEGRENMGAGRRLRSSPTD
ncbi:MAG: hypothetical protein Q9164_001520 [Protoblastenia rupestris]